MSKEVTINKTAISSGNYDYEKKLAELSTEDKQKAVALTANINVHDLASVQTYGQELSSVIASNGDSLLRSVRADNSSAVVELTNELLGELNMIDIDELNASTKWKKFVRSIPIIGRMVTSVQNVMVKYDTIAENVDKIAKKIDSAKIVAMRDNSTLQTIFDNNVTYIEQIRDLIIAAKLKDKELDDTIKEMQTNPDKYEIYEIQDMQSLQNSLQKRITDMIQDEFIMEQNLMQIRAMQGNNLAISEKSDNIVNNIIPLWKNQLAISVIMNNQKASIEAQQKISDTTNKIMQKNAEMLKINSIQVAKANEESVVSLDTLKKTTEDFIATVKEVKKIHDDGAKERQLIESTVKSLNENLESVINDF